MRAGLYGNPSSGLLFMQPSLVNQCMPTRGNPPWLSRDIFRAIHKCNYLFRKSKGHITLTISSDIAQPGIRLCTWSAKLKRTFSRVLLSHILTPKTFGVQLERLRLTSDPFLLNWVTMIPLPALPWTKQHCWISFLTNVSIKSRLPQPSHYLRISLCLHDIIPMQKTLNLLFPLSVPMYLVVLTLLLQGCLSCLHTRLLHPSVKFSISLSVKGSYLKNGSMLTWLQSQRMATSPLFQAIAQYHSWVFPANYWNGMCTTCFLTTYK